MGTPAQTRADGWLARQGAKAQRAILCRLANIYFDEDTAKQLSALMKHSNDIGRLSRIADWIRTSESGEEFLTRVENGRHPNGESSD